MIDTNGLIVQENGDGGDCPCRCGVVIGAAAIWPSKYPQWQGVLGATHHYLQPSPDVYMRYPTPPMNAPYDPNWGFSRDQASRLMLGYGIAGHVDLVKGFYKRLVKNWLRHQNGDFIGTGEPGNIIRSLHLWYLYPLLFVLDAKFLFDVTFGVANQPFDYDNLMVMDLWFATTRYITPCAWLARQIYDKQAAAIRIANNLQNTATCNPCIDAYEADMQFLSML